MGVTRSSWYLAGLAQGHIQAEAHGLELFVFHLHGGVFGLTLLKAHICILLHCKFLRFLVFHADILHYLHKMQPHFVNIAEVQKGISPGGWEGTVYF